MRNSHNKVVSATSWNGLSFSKILCLHSIEISLTQKHHRHLGPHPKYVAISNYKNLLFCYWNDGDSQAYVTTWKLSTGKQVLSDSLTGSHSLALGNNGRIGISNDYDPHILDLDTQSFSPFVPEPLPQTNIPNSSVSVSPSELPLAAFWEHIGPRTEIELWNYEQGQQQFRYVNTETYQSANNFEPDSNQKEVCFSPDGSLLIAKFYFHNDYVPSDSEERATCSLKVWDTHSAELIHDSTSNLRPMSGCSKHPEEGFLLYGIRERQVTIHRLLNDQILFQQPGHAPCNMTLELISKENLK